VDTITRPYDTACLDILPDKASPGEVATVSFN